MITQQEIQKAARQWKIQDHILEKDYVLGWLLWGISQHPVLSQAWVLKGGSAIKKCYVDTHRYSQDLDFTVLPDAPWQPDELRLLFKEILLDVNQESGIDFSVQEPRFELRPHGNSCEGRIYYVGPRGNPSPTAVKLDITHAEDLMRPPVLRPIAHPYSDTFPDDIQLYCYSLDELFAEKIRALGERANPGDLYDIIYLFRRSDLNAEPELISEVLEHKCSFKGIPVPCIAELVNHKREQEMQLRWEPMLGRAVGYLPPLESYLEELDTFFAWLNGEEYEIGLEAISDDDAWIPPLLDWQRGQSELLEPIRFAATNRLLLNLGYQGSFRLIEPYSLRRTRAGNILFYALKARSRQTRSYRLDRVQSVEVTHNPFKPVYRIEFTPEGRIPVPYIQRRRRFTSNRLTSRYAIECATCGKRFYRKRYNTRINPHKHKDYGYRCSGRHGYLV